MNTTSRCFLCSNDFEVSGADHLFYKKIGVPAPSLCPVCRFRRRALWRNERTLYSRSCDLCSKAMISMYAPSAPYPVYCQACFFSDAWSPTAYARDYDANRPVMEQFAELFRLVPKLTLTTSGNNTNSDYQNWAGSNSDCYMVFNCGENERLMYSRGMRSCRDSLDCYYGVNAELAYECIGIFDSSRMHFAQNIRSCMECWFLRDCIGCTNCFGCVNLRYKDYHFLNEPLSKEEYARRVKETIGSLEKFERFKKEYEALSRSLPFKENHNLKSEDSSGDYVVDSKNCHSSFEVDKAENCSYNFFTKSIKDSLDCTGFGYESELLYETVATGHSNSMISTVYADYSSDCLYSHALQSCMECFLCDGLRHSRFAILNTVYGEDEYRALKTRIIDQMKQEGIWGEFFASMYAPFAFNETIAMDYFPLSKEDAIASGYRWSDDMPGTIGKETISLMDIPESIADVQETVTKEVLACSLCSRNYKITAQEFAFYRHRGVPIPRRCFNCRHADRLKSRGPMVLFAGKCAECRNDIQTTVSPEEQLTVLCESCYTAAVS